MENLLELKVVYDKHGECFKVLQKEKYFFGLLSRWEIVRYIRKMDITGDVRKQLAQHQNIAIDKFSSEINSIVRY